MVFSSSWTGSIGNDSFAFDQSDETALSAKGLGGDDTIDLQINSIGSLIEGGDGNDSIGFDRPSDYTGAELSNIRATTVRGGDGDDTIFVAQTAFNVIQNSVFNGNGGNDSINIGRAEYGKGDFPKTLINTSVFGGQGNDTIYIYFADVIQGGVVNGNAGNDTIEIESVSGPINGSKIFGGQGNDSILVDVTELSQSIVQGDLGNDTLEIYGDLFASTLRGGDGNDTIYVFEDKIAQNSIVNGNANNDSIYVYSVTDGSSVQGGQGNDSIYIENNGGVVNGNLGNDSIYVNYNADPIDSNIPGSVYGGKGDDSIYVSSGNGKIYGNLGADTLNGGSGKDAFTYAFGDTALIGTAGFDSIRNFDSSADKIDLTGTNLSFNIAGLVGPITIDPNAIVTGGVASLSQFVAAGASLTTAGAAIGIDSSTISAGSFVFISNGNGTLDTEDLLIAFDSSVTKLTFAGGDIIGIV